MTARSDAQDVWSDQDVVQLHGGRAIVVVLDDCERIVWWGSHGDTDRMATADGQVPTWSSMQDCRDDTHDAGWMASPTSTSVDEPHPDDVIDYRPARARPRRPGTPLDHRSALGLWKLQGDVVASRTGSYPFLSRTQLRWHHELTAAEVPWLAGVQTHRPRWTAPDLRCIRAALNTAVHTLRTSLAPPRPATRP